MKVAITGASGLIGSALTTHLGATGHHVVGLRRPLDWDPEGGAMSTEALRGIDALVHLAGVGIAESRWTAAQKEAIRRSRVEGTSLVARTLAAMNDGPRVFISASGIGFYGDHGDDIIDESTPVGHDFLAEVAQEWEAATAPAAAAGVRVVLARSGQVLSAGGGSLAKQLPFFRLGLGGRVGSGRQWVSWITIDDEVAAIEWLLRSDVSGPVNLVSPNPVRNAEFAATLGRLLHRPTFVIPMIGPRLLYGRELADSLLLTSQRVAPTALVERGFEFRTPTLDEALSHLLR